MNFKKIWAYVLGGGAVVGIAIAHNIDAILANPTVLGSIVVGALSAYLFGHDHGTTGATVKLTNGPTK